MDQIDWPRRGNGHRRRASTPRVIKRARLLRPMGWLLRVLVLILVAGPALFLTSPGYVAFADRMPDVSKLEKAVPTDTVVYAADGTSLLADLHGPGYEHYAQHLADMGTPLAEAATAIADRKSHT